MLIGASLVLSLFFFGLLRTGLIFLPIVLIPSLIDTIAAVWLSFFAVAVALAPYREGAFDWSQSSKERRILALFLISCLTTTFFTPLSLFPFALGTLLPILWLRVFALVRWEMSPVFFFSPKLRLIVPLSWLFIFVGERY